MFRGLRGLFFDDDEIINLINDGNLSEIEEIEDEDENELVAAEGKTFLPNTNNANFVG